MKFSTFGFLGGQAVSSIRRNGLMSLASIGIVAVSLFLLGTFLMMALNANMMATAIETDVEIAVLLDSNASAAQVQSVSDDVSALGEVINVTHIAKDQALDSMEMRFGEEHDLLQSLGGINPLPDSLIVKVREPRLVGEVADTIGRFNFVDKVRYGQGWVEQLFAVLDWVRWLGAGVVVLLSLAAVFLIAITVRLTVFARKDEIAIMKYVGATNWFIRLPFFVEGLLLGTFGSLLAGIGLYFGYSQLVGYVAATVNFVPMITDMGYLLNILVYLLAGGALLGACGSAVSVRKFLKV
ncbi:permease-like cell division protein FtsX [Metallumcola ferriviriculae]|uniref:Cell division protein FtsX n=1 Tax=Metallumcola ferriviriculae TaxID=3039180 RepID=A0AAU0UK85_9FIRM|nr:permease-like cell division protein FtsX [Desulfitibacteraceae bacterium MK1]